MLDNLRLEKSIDNYDIFRICTGNKWKYLGSLYNMKKEVKNIQDLIKDISSGKSIVVFGGANGVWVRDIDKVAENKEIVIVEPNRELFDKLVSNKYNIKNNTVRVICMEDENFYHNLLTAVSKSNFEILVFANYDIVFRDKFKEFIDKIIFMFNDKKLNENTKKYFARQWFINFTNNLLHLDEFERVDSYKNMFKGKPAVIVSAGPSLEKNLKYLKGNEDKFIIITGIRTLLTLNKEGIKADFACVMDSSKEMYNVAKYSFDSNVPLLINDTGNPNIIKNYCGKKILFNEVDFVNASRYLLGVEMDLLFQGGSVAHTCVSFARLMGCDPIIFIGQDLAYTDNKLHANGAVVEGESNEVIDTGIYVKGVVEEKVLTNHDLNMFRERLETMIRIYNDTRFINCTEGGAHIEGTEVGILKDVISKFKEPIDKTFINKVKPNIKTDKSELLNKLKRIYDEVNNLITLCDEAVKLNSELRYLYLQGKNSRYNRALKRLDEIDEYFRNQKEVMYIFNPLIECINAELSRIYADKDAAKYEEKADKIEIIAEKGKWLYSELKKMFEFGNPVLSEVIEKMEASL